MGRWLAGLFHGHPNAHAGSLLAGPVGWLVIGYLGSLAVLLITAFWSIGELSGEIERTATLENFKTIVNEPVYRDVADQARADGRRSDGKAERLTPGHSTRWAGEQPRGRSEGVGVISSRGRATRSRYPSRPPAKRQRACRRA